MVEAVLEERIRGRRVELLDAFRSKVQPCLFGRRTFERRKLVGWLVRVAHIEALHVPAHALPWRRVALPDPDWTPAPSEPDDAPDETGHYLDLLGDLWSRANGFSAEQRLEALISLGLGGLTGDEGLAQRCRALLEARTAGWDDEGELLGDRISRVLARWEAVKRRRDACSCPQEREQLTRRLEELERAQDRLEQKRASRPLRLRPRPAEGRELLAELVRNPGLVRHRRINREVQLMRRRTAESQRELESSAPGAQDARDLGTAVARHLGEEPPSPAVRKLAGKVVDAAARRALRADHTLWLEEGGRLLAEARRQLRAVFHDPMRPALRCPLQEFLADVEDLYELGVLGRRGILGGLGRRHGWRLEWLLRSGPPRGA
jgi:hypothetical protein